MSDLLTFYGFGIYVVGDDVLGVKVVFLFAPSKEEATKKFLEVMGKTGKVIASSLKLVSGTTILRDWLLAAAMESNDADWSSGVNAPSILMRPTTPKEEYLC